MNYESFFNLPSEYSSPSKASLPESATSRTAPFSALTNNADYDATFMSSAGPSSHNHTDFHALPYPHNIAPMNETCTLLMEQHSKQIPVSSLSTLDVSGMFDLDIFNDYHTNFFHPDTPSSASSASEVMTPITSYGETELPTITSRNKEDQDVDMDAHLGDQLHCDQVTPHFSELPLAMSKSALDDTHVDWSQLLAAMCYEHPETVQWFAEMGGFQPDSDQMQMAVPQHELPPIQSLFSIYPHQHSNTLSDFMSSPSNLPPFVQATPVSASHSSSHSNTPSISIPLHHPRPVRPIPQIPLKDLAAVALRLGKPVVRRESTESLSSFTLLRQPGGDPVRSQRKPFSAGDVNTDR